MESFTLGPNPKIDFSSAQQPDTTATASQRMVRHNHSEIHSLSSTEFNTEFLQTTCITAFIYRLQESKFTSDLNYLGGVRRVAEGVRTDNCAIGFPRRFSTQRKVRTESSRHPDG
jgi:hypothetical protein